MNEINYIQILILALIQGAAELLPVSSSAHVILAAKLMHLKPESPQFIFLLVMLQMMTALRPIIGTTDTFLPPEKKFFVSHWMECLKAGK